MSDMVQLSDQARFDERLARKVQAEEDGRYAQQLHDSACRDKQTSSAPAKGAPGSRSVNIKDGNTVATQAEDPSPVYSMSGLSLSQGSHMYSNKLTEAASLRAQDEMPMRQRLQRVQHKYKVLNPEIEPEHDTYTPCHCDACSYRSAKWKRFDVLDVWNKAVMYPGEKPYNCSTPYVGPLSGNPYVRDMPTPYEGSYIGLGWTSPIRRPIPKSHAKWLRHTIALDGSLNEKGLKAVENHEPKANIWDPAESNASERVEDSMGKMGKLKSLLKAGEEKRAEKTEIKASDLRRDILQEEEGRWPDASTRGVVKAYQIQTGIITKVAHLRNSQPIQYLHLLRAGYFEPMPLSWMGAPSSPLKFAVNGAEGWRGITPCWRGYDVTAEERLYWVLNHRQGDMGTCSKPDVVLALDSARKRMASAVPAPSGYYDAGDVCHIINKSGGYSAQVPPSPWIPLAQQARPEGETMILLDVSGSMGFPPLRPIYDQYLVTGYESTIQPQNKDIAKAIVKRFVNAMANIERGESSYELTAFADTAQHLGAVHQDNLDEIWAKIEIGGGTNVMTGWQKIKDLHFTRYRATATYHPVYGWLAGPDIPMLRLLLILDGEADDMAEFELDLLGLDWAHVTIFLIGVDGCLHHHRHANHLKRMGEVNPQVQFVDAQGNIPERLVTHELLKRHLGRDIPLKDFELLEQPPPTYKSAVNGV